MTDEDISRIEVKSVKGLKAFNDAFKDGLGYQMPDGPIVTWNDFARMFNKRLPRIDLETHRKTENTKKVQEYADEVFDYMYVKGYFREVTTSMGEFVNDFNAFMQDALNDGLLGVFVRSDGSDGADRKTLYPKEMLRERTSRGYMLSKTEVLRTLDEYVARGLADTPNQQKAAGRLYEMFDKIFDALPDHADIKMRPVNNPVPLSKVKNLSCTGGMPNYRRAQYLGDAKPDGKQVYFAPGIGHGSRG